MMFEKFTERAQNVILYAKDESIDLQHGFIGTEHILLGILKEEGMSKNILNSMGVSLENIKDLIEKMEGKGDLSIAQNEVPLTPRTKRLLDLSLLEARNLNHNYVTPEHILLALISESEGVAFNILKSVQVNFDKLRSELINSLSGEGEVNNSSKGKVKGSDTPTLNQ